MKEVWLEIIEGVKTIPELRYFLTIFLSLVFVTGLFLMTLGVSMLFFSCF